MAFRTVCRPWNDRSGLLEEPLRWRDPRARCRCASTRGLHPGAPAPEVLAPARSCPTSGRALTMERTSSPRRAPLWRIRGIRRREPTPGTARWSDPRCTAAPGPPPALRVSRPAHTPAQTLTAASPQANPGFVVPEVVDTVGRDLALPLDGEVVGAHLLGRILRLPFSPQAHVNVPPAKDSMRCGQGRGARLAESRPEPPRAFGRLLASRHRPPARLPYPQNQVCHQLRSKATLAACQWRPARYI